MKNLVIAIASWLYLSSPALAELVPVFTSRDSRNSTSYFVDTDTITHKDNFVWWHTEAVTRDRRGNLITHQRWFTSADCRQAEIRARELVLLVENSQVVNRREKYGDRGPLWSLDRDSNGESLLRFVCGGN